MTNIEETIEVLKQGGVIIFPSDTVWGIGCLLTNEKAIERVYDIRNRPKEKAVLAIVSSIEMAEEYLLPIPTDVKKNLMEKYWPGGLTIILPCDKSKVPPIARANKNTLAVRQTNHKTLINVINTLGIPLIAPSANLAGEKTPTKFSEIDKKLLSLVDFVLEGNSLGQEPSTIIDCSIKPWKIVREGEIKINIKHE